MKFAIERFGLWSGLVGTLCLVACSSQIDPNEEVQADPLSTDTLRQSVLRDAAIRNGLVPAGELTIAGDAARQEIGGKLFASELLSFNSEISCQSCHLDQFSSADGLPNAIGVGGQGEGRVRLESGGVIVPRNALPLWGRGSLGFNAFFWDGKVEATDGGIVSQFGEIVPSDDPLTVAVHLPFVEIREMLENDAEVRDELMTEDVASAERVYRILASRIQADAELGTALAEAYDIDRDDIAFGQIADAIAQFIRHRFRIRPTPLHRFVFADGSITENALRGGIIFYGKGRCAACHNGPYFSDFGFHTVPYPQAGFGRNGFGVDLGRYNVTFRPGDRYKFRSPPLYNVTRTGPYSHSGAITDLQQAIIYHFDPLRYVDPEAMSASERTEEYRRIGVASNEQLPANLTNRQVRDLAAFLAMLEF